MVMDVLFIVLSEEEFLKTNLYKFVITQFAVKSKIENEAHFRLLVSGYKW